MSIHDAFLELAATAIDYPLDDNEWAELDRHLAGCDACRRAAAGFDEDAATIAFGAKPNLSPGRSEAILAAAMRPPQRSSPLRLLAVAAPRRRGPGRGRCDRTGRRRPGVPEALGWPARGRLERRQLVGCDPIGRIREPSRTDAASIRRHARPGGVAGHWRAPGPRFGTGARDGRPDGPVAGR